MGVLQQLLNGNARFILGETEYPHQDRMRRKVSNQPPACCSASELHHATEDACEMRCSHSCCMAWQDHPPR